jgi:hypothetical protein
MKKRGRPELFNEAKRVEFLALIGGSHSRHAAATAVGIAPSTVSKRLKWDVEYAEAVRAAEQIPETDLLTVMRKHCEKSWLATRWLLEIKHPERYCKRKGHAEFGPSADDVFDAVIGVLDEEIADEKLRQRIEARLDGLAEQEFFNAGGAMREAEEAEETAHEQQAAGEAPVEALDAATQAEAGHDESQEPAPSDRPEPTHEFKLHSPQPQPHVAEAQLPEPPLLEPIVEPPPIEGDHLFNEPDQTPIEAPSPDKLSEPPPPAVLAARLQARKLNEEKRRLRKQCNKDRARQCKQRRHAKQLKKSRPRPR